MYVYVAAFHLVWFMERLMRHLADIAGMILMSKFT